MNKFSLKIFIFFALITTGSLILFFLTTTLLTFLPPLITLLVLLLLSTTICYFLANMLTSPLQKLTDESTKIQNGSLNTQISIKGSPELEKVASTINLLVFHLNQTLKNFDQARQMIEVEKNKTQATLGSIVDAVVAVDLNKNIVLFNKAAEQLTNFPSQQVIGKPIIEVFKLSDKNKEIPQENYCPPHKPNYEGIVYSQAGIMFESLSPTIQNDITHKHRFVNLTVGQIKDGQTANLGCILTFHDITEEKELQEMQLDFVSMAAHELRTPLTSIKGYLSVFMDETKGKLTKEQDIFMMRIMNSAQHLTALIENLLSVSRIERGALTINLEPLDWLSLVKLIIAELEMRAREKNIELQLVEPNQKLSQIKADKLRINEVLTNLVANAINYTPAHGKVSVWIEEKNGNVVTHVQDTGPGIPQELQHHLFNKFYRVGSKLTQGTKGTGLGLYIAKAIIDMHHGQIWVESEPGKGSTFSFSVPAYDRTKLVFELPKIT